MASKLLNLLAISSLAILACSFGATPVNALSSDHQMLKRHAVHDGIAAKKRKRQSKRCIARSISGAPASSTWVPSPSPTPAPPPASSWEAPPPPSSTYAPPPPPPSSSSYAAPSPTSSPSGKRGLGWNDPNDNEATNLQYFKSDLITYVQTWSAYKPATADQLGLLFMAQLWGADKLDEWQSLITPGYAYALVGFNEADLSSQANLDPGYAAQLWQQYIQPWGSQGFKLVSPPTSAAPSGDSWMTSFVAACNGCWWNSCGAHFYGTNPEDLKNYVTNWSQKYNCAIDLLEYAPQDFGGNSQDDLGAIYNFYGEVNPWMDQQSFIHSYFAFGTLPADLMGGVNQNAIMMASNGQPNDLGNYYVNGN